MLGLKKTQLNQFFSRSSLVSKLYLHFLIPSFGFWVQAFRCWLFCLLVSLFYLVLRSFKRSLSRVTHISWTGLATHGILFNVNYVTLNRQSHLAICPFFSPKVVLLWTLTVSFLGGYLNLAHTLQCSILCLEHPQAWLIMRRKLLPLFARKKQALCNL
jgi:hypothetical protein